jgi:hypothetical protein
MSSFPIRNYKKAEGNMWPNRCNTGWSLGDLWQGETVVLRDRQIKIWPLPLASFQGCGVWRTQAQPGKVRVNEPELRVEESRGHENSRDRVPGGRGNREQRGSVFYLPHLEYSIHRTSRCEKHTIRQARQKVLHKPRQWSSSTWWPLDAIEGHSKHETLWGWDGTWLSWAFFILEVEGITLEELVEMMTTCTAQQIHVNAGLPIRCPFTRLAVQWVGCWTTWWLLCATTLGDSVTRQPEFLRSLTLPWDHCLGTVPWWLKCHHAAQVCILSLST